MKLISLQSATNDGTVWIDPEIVRALHPSGLPGCTVIECSIGPTLVVLGSPDDVKTKLEPAS